MAIIMNEFLPVPNIAPSGYILLCNNLSYVICVMFLGGLSLHLNHLIA